MGARFIGGVVVGGLLIGTWVSVNRQAEGPAMEQGVGDATSAFAGVLGEGAKAVPKVREAIQPALNEVADVASNESDSGAAANNEGPDPDAGGTG